MQILLAGLNYIRPDTVTTLPPPLLPPLSKPIPLLHQIGMFCYTGMTPEMVPVSLLLLLLYIHTDRHVLLHRHDT
jgi:hypothetical protein